MTKTQIQLPDDLYRRVKRFAAEREWSMAETFRRAVEEMFERYPEGPESGDEWTLPPARDLGWKGLSPEESHRAALDEMEGSDPAE